MKSVILVDFKNKKLKDQDYIDAFEMKLNKVMMCKEEQMIHMYELCETNTQVQAIDYDDFLNHCIAVHREYTVYNYGDIVDSVQEIAAMYRQRRAEILDAEFDRLVNRGGF